MIKVREIEDRKDIANLLAEGYTIHIDITLKRHPEDGSESPSQYHVVKVRDPRNHNKIVSEGESWLFFEALGDAYMMTPERE